MSGTMLRTAVVLAGMLAALPAAGAAQSVGASFRVVDRPVQPDVTMAAGPAAGPSLSASVPAGWAWSVERGGATVSEAGPSPRLAGGAIAGRVEVNVPVQSTASAATGVVTWTFVPI